MTTLEKRLLSGGAWAFAGKVITVISSLAVNALLARLLTPETMGAYFLTFSFVSVSAMVARLGLSRAVVRLIAESMGTDRPARAAKAVRIALVYGALGAIIVAGTLLMGVGGWLAEHVFDSALMNGVVGLSCLWVIVLTFQVLLAEIFRGFHDIRLATIFGGLMTTILSTFLFAGLWVIQGHSDLQQIITLSVTAGITSALMAGLLMLGKLKSIKGEGEILKREIFAIAWPLWLANILLTAFSQVDIWIMGIFCPQDEVAIYGAAARLVALIAMPLSIVKAVIPPSIAETYAQGGHQETEQILRVTATAAGIPAFFVLLLLIFFGAPLLGLIYGDFYMAAYPALLLLSAAHMVNVLTGAPGVLLIMSGKQTIFMTATFLSGIAGLSVSISLVQSMSYTGVALGASLSVVLLNIFMWTYCSRFLGIFTHMGLSREQIIWARWVFERRMSSGFIWFLGERSLRVLESILRIRDKKID